MSRPTAAEVARGRRVMTPEVAQLVEDGWRPFRAHMLVHGAAACTIRQRVYFATSRAKEWGRLDLSAVEFAEWLSGYSGWTRNTYLNHSRALFGWAVAEGLIEVNPAVPARLGREPRPRPTPLAADEVRRVLETATGDLYVWLQLGRLQGLRSFEIAKLHGRDVESRTLFVRGKAGGEWTLPTHPKIWALAQEYPRDDYWFPSRFKYREHASESYVGNHVRDHFRQMGIPSGSIHRMRHTYASELRRAGADSALIQQLMRHESLATTERYLSVLTEELEAAIRLLVA